jgi:hypothetical protein
MFEVDNLDGSYSKIFEGCDADFLDKLSVHLGFNKELFLQNGVELDGSFEQLKEVEKLIKNHRELADWHTRNFYQGLVAYCGELLRHKIPGEWSMIKSAPCLDYPKTRYFPVIVDAENQTYSFSASVEWQLAYLLDPGLNWDKMDGLYYAVLFCSLRPDLPPHKDGALTPPF